MKDYTEVNLINFEKRIEECMELLLIDEDFRRKAAMWLVFECTKAKLRGEMEEIDQLIPTH